MSSLIQVQVNTYWYTFQQEGEVVQVSVKTQLLIQGMKGEVWIPGQRLQTFWIEEGLPEPEDHALYHHRYASEVEAIYGCMMGAAHCEAGVPFKQVANLMSHRTFQVGLVYRVQDTQVMGKLKQEKEGWMLQTEPESLPLTEEEIAYLIPAHSTLSYTDLTEALKRVSGN